MKGAIPILSMCLEATPEPIVRGVCQEALADLYRRSGDKIRADAQEKLLRHEIPDWRSDRRREELFNSLW